MPDRIQAIIEATLSLWRPSASFITWEHLNQTLFIGQPGFHQYQSPSFLVLIRPSRRGCFTQANPGTWNSARLHATTDQWWCVLPGCTTSLSTIPRGGLKAHEGLGSPSERRAAGESLQKAFSFALYGLIYGLMLFFALLMLLCGVLYPSRW